MASIAAFITQAINKVSTDETYANIEFATADEARENFTAALLFELGLGPKPVAAHAPVPEPKAEEAPKKKRAAPKKSKEAAVAEAAVAILEQVKEAPKEVEALTEQMGKLALEEQPKAKKARKTKEEPAAPMAAANAGAGADPAKKKPGPKPKAKEGAGNLEKLTPTHKKHIKAIATELKVEPQEKEFLAYANAMSAEEWSAKTLDDHIRAFLMPDGAPVLADPPTEFLEVEFNGTDYLVDPATRFVYTATASPTVKSRSHVGVVGLLEFKDMQIP